MSKNLITGINGFVASHLADFLISKGEDVVGTYRKNYNLSKISHILDKVILIEMDLNNLESCLYTIENIKPDYIYHLAGMSHVSESMKKPRETFEANVLGTVNLLEAVRFVKQKNNSFNPVVHFCSTGNVYGAVEKENLPITEKTPTNPVDIYGFSKLSAEFAALGYYSNFGVKIIITRSFSHTGPRRTMMSADVNFAKQIALIEAGKQKPIIKHGNLDSSRTWADVRDISEAYYLLVRKCKPGEIYNIAGNEVRTIGEMLDNFISISSDDKIKKVQDLNLGNNVSFQEVDIGKFVHDSGWEPKYSFEQTMGDLLNWWREEVKE